MLNESKIINTVKSLQKDFGLDNWDISFDFINNKKDIGLAKISVINRIAKIYINPESNKNDKDILITLLHEFYHILINKLSEQCKLGKKFVVFDFGDRAIIDKKTGLTTFDAKEKILKEMNKDWDNLGKIIEMFRDAKDLGDNTKINLENIK